MSEEAQPSDTGSLRTFVAKIRPYLSSSPDQSPRSTPEIFGTTRKENVWHSYLAYFIDPTENHGFGDRFLLAFIHACESEGAFDRTINSIDSDRISVDSEISTGAGRQPDLLLTDPENWFLLVELKVDSPEGSNQTADYAAASQLDSVAVDEYDADSRWYGYVAPDIPDSIADEFNGVRWSVVAEKFEEERSEITPSEYPLRSIVQLDDFITTLETTMPEIDQETREQAELYFEYHDEIQSAERAAERYVKEIIQYEWTTVFTDPESSPSFWDESWYIRRQGKRYGQIARQSWGLENDLNIHFEHKPELERFRSGELVFRVDLEAPTETRREGTDPRTAFRDHFISLANSEQVSLPETAQVDDGDGTLNAVHKLVKTDYSFQPGNAEDYYNTLIQAAEDHADLIPVIDALFENHPDIDNPQLDQRE